MAVNFHLLRAVKWGVAGKVKTFYDELASDYHLIFEDWEALHQASSSRSGAYTGTRAFVNHTSDSRLCCGIGTQTLGLAGRGYRVTACDLSSAAVQRMCAEASQRRLNVQGFVANLLDLTPIPEGF
jgi:glycine/sarcosine N-methyltransferase